MEIRAMNDADTTADSVYYFKKDKKPADVMSIFAIRRELWRLRVKTDRLNYLYGKLSPKTFRRFYNDFRQRLNFDFSDIQLNGCVHTFSEDEQIALEQKMICDLLYFYTINNFKRLLIKKDDFTHSLRINDMISFVQSLYKCSHNESLLIAAHIYRIESDKMTAIDEQNQKWIGMW